ncbi:MAG: hypothetical protein ACXW07_06570, partial [Nitrososphaeraceae archaeon]
MSIPNVTTRSAAASKRGSLADITIHGGNVNVNTGGSNNTPNGTNYTNTNNNINTPIMPSHIENKTIDPINNVSDTNNNNVDALQLIARALQQLTNQSMQTSIGSPKPPTQSSNMVNNYNNTSLADRAAVDDRSTMPALAKFDSKIIKPDAFIEWKQKTTEVIDGHPRYSPLLLNVEQGWQTFLKANSKYTIDKVERFYLETQKSLWSLIIVCFDSDVITSITAEMKEEALIEPLPELLNFTSCIDPEFYKDCRKLLDKLSSRYEIKSGWSICDLIKRISSLQYRPTQEPIIYIELFHTLYRKLKILNPKLSIPNEFLAYQMLGQLPVDCQAVKMQFLNPTEPPQLEKVEEVLLSWWQSQQTNKPRDHNKDQHNKTPKSKEGKPKFKNQVEGEQKQDVANPATTSPPTKQSKKKDFQKKNNNNSTKGKQSDNDDSDHELALIDYPEEPTTTNNNAAVSSIHRVQPTNKQIALDSGATSHIVGRKDILDDIHHIAPCRVAGLTGTCKVDSAGKLKLAKGITLNSVKYVPNSPFNLMSVSQIVNKGYQVIFTQEGGFVVKPESIPDRFYTNPNNVVLKTRQEGNLFVYDLTEKRIPVNARYGDFTVDTEGSNNDNNNKSIASVASDNTVVASVASVASDTSINDDTPITDVAAVVKPEKIKVDIGIQTNLNVELNKDVDNLHSKLAHLGPTTLELTSEHYELGISKKAIENHSNTNCTTCISCKAKREPIGKKTANPSRKAENIMDCWHVDLIGPLSEVNKDGKRIHLPSLQGKIYILVIV